MRPRPAWLQENLAAVEITTNAPAYPHLKSLDWWLSHPYPACPCNVIAYDTWHWVRQHRRLPHLRQQPKGAGIKSDRRVVFAQIATELSAEAQTRFTPHTADWEHFLVMEGYQRGLSSHQIAGLLGRTQHYVDRRVDELVFNHELVPEGLGTRRDRFLINRMIQS